MALTDKQAHRVDRIMFYMDDLLDKRFAQARRINPVVGGVEADVRWNQGETMRRVLTGGKAFGPVKILVADILCSHDADKTRALFNPTDQASIMTEIIAVAEEAGEKRAGQLEIHDVRSMYRALNPSLEKVLLLVQTWIWWDLRDAADMVRFEAQVQRLRVLKDKEFDKTLEEYYHREMHVRPDEALDMTAALRFELGRLKGILDKYRERVNVEPGYQMIVVNLEREGSPEADTACLGLARRLMAIDKVRAQPNGLDDNVRKFYANQMKVSPEEVTAAAIVTFEEAQARLERAQLADNLASLGNVGRSANYKQVKLDELDQQYRSVHDLLALPEAPAAAPAAHGVVIV